MKNIVNAFAIALFIGMSTLGHAQPVTVSNSGFETPDSSLLGLGILGGVQTYVYNSSTTTYLTGSSGWYVSSPGGGTAGSITIVNQGILGALLSPISGDSSSQYIALNGLVLNLLPASLTTGALGGISQSITTTVGQTYLVTYQAGALSLGVATANQAVLSAGVDGVTVTSPSGGSLLSLNVGTFQDQSFTFTAASTQSVLDFYEPNALLANVGGVAIDNVSVTAVPEPSHTMVIFLGFVMALSLIRQMRKANSFIIRGKNAA